MKKTPSKNQMPVWNLKLLYRSATDPEIEKDAVAFITLYEDFGKRFDTPEKKYLGDEDALLETLTAYEKLVGYGSPRPLQYYALLSDIEAENPVATSQLSLLSSRFTKAGNAIRFFWISLGKISALKQKQFLESKKLQHFHFFLKCIFEEAKHVLSVPEEKILALKGLPGHEMWKSHNDRILNVQTVTWRNKKIPLAEAFNQVQSLLTQKDRASLAAAIAEVLKSVAVFSEGEINAIYTDKKINDELRGFKTPYEGTVLDYQNDPNVIDTLRKTVSEEFTISQKFYKLKAKLLKAKKLNYSDRAAKFGKIRASFSFEDSYAELTKTFGALNPKFADILKRYIDKGEIDAKPRQGKTGGAYCWGSYAAPTFVLLNHIGDLHSFTIFAHEMGHAFHTELSKKSQGPIYSGYSTSLAETASTLFESIALEAIFDKLSDKEKIIVLHDKINDDISTIFRQIACFNFELELHTQIRAKGFLTKEEIAAIHNKNMQAYLGPIFKLQPDDGYMFVQWSHIRRFFYVYSYAYGMLVSKALLRRYKADKRFWGKIEIFLSSGGKASPEEILKEIGIDVSSASFWLEGLKEIEEDIKKLEKLTLKKK